MTVCGNRELSTSRVKRQIPGGLSPANVSDPVIQEMANIGLNHINNQSNSACTQEVVRIIEASQQIPSHCGILGNENVDALAKKGSTATYRHVTKSTYYSVKRFIKSTYLDFNKQNLITQSQGKKWNSLHQNPQLIPDLPRKSSVAAFRLATGHDCLVKHLHRIGIYQSPNCPLCNSNQEMDLEYFKICASVNDSDNIFEKITKFVSLKYGINHGLISVKSKKLHVAQHHSLQLKLQTELRGDGRQMVWRKPKEKMKTKNLRATVKHGGGNMMIWECMSASGVGELVFIEDIMKKEDYLHLLQHNLVKSAEKLGIEKEFMFYQNNDPKHNSYIVQEYLLYKFPKVLHPPPQSPDLNLLNIYRKNLTGGFDQGLFLLKKR
ncbi:hypothetical protein ANN_09530 [Periplaneta americana]|uniref:Uncharacterized protein n=1 Tax=Periplaneta americana TaxID=6978 RepID=A0ABQ8TLK2_PERAM|nr:hypothetical protein ANN_09530 [Periplaneta americana]